MPKAKAKKQKKLARKIASPHAPEKVAKLLESGAQSVQVATPAAIAVPVEAPAAAVPKAVPVHAGIDAEESKRLDAMGLEEVAVEGTHLRLIGLKDGKAKPTTEQRVEMAKRMVDVGPRLPKYVPQRIAVPAPGAAPTTTNDGEASMAKSKLPKDPSIPKGETPSGIPGVSVEQVDASFEKNKKEYEAKQKKLAKEEAAKKKAEEDKLRAAAKARKKGGKAKLANDADKFLSPEGKARVAKMSADSKAAAKASKKGAKPDAKKKPDAAPKPGKAGGKATAAPAAGGKKASIGGLTQELLLAGKSTEEVLAGIKKQFPNAKSSASTIGWYRSKMRSEGALPKK